MDMYEHAYKADFGGDPAKYVDSFVQMVRWVDARAALSRGDQGLIAGARALPVPRVHVVEATR